MTSGHNSSPSSVRGSSGSARLGDRKSTRLNSSHSQISYAVFCLKKKKLLPDGLGMLGVVRLVFGGGSLVTSWSIVAALWISGSMILMVVRNRVPGQRRVHYSSA